MWWRGSLLLCLALLCGGCVPVGWVMPPTRVSAGFGHGVKVTRRTPPTPTPPGVQPAPEVIPGPVTLTFAAHPMGFSPKWFLRRVDFGIGYHVSPETDRTDLLHGPQLDFLWFISHYQQPESRWALRISMHIQPKLLFSPNIPGVAGFQNSIKFIAEFARTAYTGASFGGCDGSGCLFGIAFGELSFGLFMELGHGYVDNDHFLDFRGGLTILLPFSAAVGLVNAWR